MLDGGVHCVLIHRSADQIRVIFSDVDTIYAINCNFLAELEERMEHWSQVRDPTWTLNETRTDSEDRRFIFECTRIIPNVQPLHQ